MLLLSSCEIIDLSRGEPYKNPKEQAENILLFLEEGNVEAIREMFCERLKNQENIDEKIQEAIDLLDGKIISHKLVGGGGRAHWGSDGNRVIENGGGHNIRTDTDKVYHLFIGIYKENDFDSDLIGIFEFAFSERDENDEVYLVRIEIKV